MHCERPRPAVGAAHFWSCSANRGVRTCKNTLFVTGPCNTREALRVTHLYASLPADLTAPEPDKR